MAEGNGTQGSDAIMRNLIQESARSGARLARLEFQALLQDLNNGALSRAYAFELPDFPGQPDDPISLIPDFAGRPMPDSLEVPLGAIAFSNEKKDLPTIGIYCPDDPGLVNALPRLLLDLNQRAFARLVFLCQSLEIIPFLGRYGFCFHVMGSTETEEDFLWASKKFGVSEVRSALSTELLWKRR